MSRTYEPELLTHTGFKSKVDERKGVRVYFDVETYRKKDAFLEERVIAIGVIEDRGCLPTDTDQLPPIDPKRFYEWNVRESKQDAEKTIVSEFYRYLGSLRNEFRYVDVIGFNLLRFDVPLLTQKGLEFNVMGIYDLNKLWNDMFITDYIQVFLPHNCMRFKELTLDRIIRDLRIRFQLNLPEPWRSGSEIKGWYEQRRFNDIAKHLERDLEIIRQLDYIVRKKLVPRLQNSDHCWLEQPDYGG